MAELDRMFMRLSLMLAFLAVLARCAFAQEHDEALDLARACHVEAAFSEHDCSAMYWAMTRLAKRRGTTWHHELIAYSAVYKGQTPRAREIATWPWGDIPGQSFAFNAQWLDQRTYVLRILGGEVSNPCPGATQWGGMKLESDRTRAAKAVREGRWVRAECAKGTANQFYREVR